MEDLKSEEAKVVGLLSVQTVQHDDTYILCLPKKLKYYLSSKWLVKLLLEYQLGEQVPLKALVKHCWAAQTMLLVNNVLSICMVLTLYMEILANLQ